jgi:alpha/beta superfamily hydrolase
MAEDVRIVSVEIPGPTGILEGIINANSRSAPRAIAVLGHPLPTEGGTLHTKGVFHAAKGFARIGCAALRFNFRGVGRSAGVFSGGPGEQDDFRAALEFMLQRYPDVDRVWAAGMSFGAWVAMTVGAEHPRCRALIGIAPAVTHYDFSPVVRAGKPVFIVHGTLDEVIPLKEVRKLYAQLSEPKELVEIDGAGHLFDGHVTEVGDAVEDLLQDFND